jgi:ubiquinone/menaquinone biosynthesis C-methylase UbiE
MPGAETFHGPADAYDRFVGRYGPSLAAALVEFAGVEPPMRALDVGAGPGALTRLLVERLGAENVAAAEPSEPFAAALGDRLPGVELAVAPAESLPFEDGRFDAVLSQLVVNFMSDQAAGVGEMARVARPGGTVASCIWDYGGEMTLLRAYWDAAVEAVPERGAAADESATMRPRSEDELADLWRRAGLEDVRTGRLLAHASYEGFEDLWEPITTGIAPAGAFYASLDDDRRGALHDALRRRLGVGDEAFTLDAVAFAVVGRSRS